MTLIITGSSSKYAIMVGDRRLSDGEKVYDDDAVKQGFVICDDAAALYAFTGFAGFLDNLGRPSLFRTSTWIADTLSDRGGTFSQLLERLRQEATRQFRENGHIRGVQDRRLTVIFAGFYGAGDPLMALVSNFEGIDDAPRLAADDEFESVVYRSRERTSEASAVSMQGYYTAAPRQSLAELNQLLLDGRPANAFKGKAIEVVLAAADNPDSKRTIGKRLLVATLPAPANNVPPVPSSLYVTDVGVPHVVGLDTVSAISDRPLVAMRNLTISYDDNSTMTYPRQPRNAPCSCGSGRKYKWCHGR